MFVINAVRRWLAKRLPGRSLGERGEMVAANYLKKLGYRIIAQGLDSRFGELDIVAVDGRTGVFVEVKTRRSSDAGLPSDAIDPQKMRRMTQSALAYLKANRLLNNSARFDVVAITWPHETAPPSIEHFENAFTPAGIGQLFS
jgi:putative endonuclease